MGTHHYLKYIKTTIPFDIVEKDESRMIEYNDKYNESMGYSGDPVEFSLDEQRGGPISEFYDVITYYLEKGAYRIIEDDVY